MDSTTAAIVDFATSLSLSALPEAARTATKARVLDTYACAWGGVDGAPVTTAKKALLSGENAGTARVLTGERASLEAAAFVNSLMARYLDFNDAHQVAYGHPSDMILPLFNVAESTGASGEEVMLAVVAAYQVACAITLAGGTHYKRWETAFGQGPGTAVGAAMLMGLKPESIADAVGIAVACTTPLNIRKTGSVLSMWKGCAGPQASKMGIQAATLARHGMTGPDESFEGVRGVFEMITGEFDIKPYMVPSDRYQVEETTIKLYPVSGRVLGPTETTCEMRSEVGDPADIESIDIATYKYCYDFEQHDHASLVNDASNPVTRETADHSLRWLMAVSLIDGTVTKETFRPERLARTDVRDIVARMTLREDPQLTARWPEEWISDITVTMRDGRVVRRRSGRPKGNPYNPASPGDLDGKVRSLVAPYLGDAAVTRLSERVTRLEDWESAGELFDFTPEGGVAIGGVA